MSVLSRVMLRGKKVALYVCAVLIGALAADSVQGQFYFGKNKVQYTHFDWQVMTTEHFRIYFYDAEAEIAKIGARLAEDAYRATAMKFNHEVERKIPLIIYSSPSYFSQTNIVPGLLPESVGGLTEFVKGRVVVPFHGSYYDFEHVIRHEVVHVFQFSKLDANIDRRHRFRYGMPPLWFIEGQAEFWSKDWDSEADMIIKDMVLNNRLFTIPNLWQVRGSFFMYKLGESILHFIDSTYGSDKVLQIYENWHKGKSFGEVLKITIGDDLETLSRKWEYSLKKRYFPELQEKGLPRMESERITREGYCVKAVPIRWDDGRGLRDWIVFMANRMGYTGIYMKPLDGDEKSLRTLVKGERSSDFESLYLLRSGIDANDSGLIIFSSKSKEKDVIYLYDLNEERVTRRFEFEDLVASRSPRFSPDGTRVVFCGVKVSGFSDLYILDLIDGSYELLTDDIYYNTDPTFSADGSEIIFTSDRSPDGPQGALNLFAMNLATGQIRQLTFGKARDTAPVDSDRGIYFSSDREGTFNLYLLDRDGRLTRQSTYVTGALDPRLTADGKRLTYTGYQDLGFHIYEMETIAEPEPVIQSMAQVQSTWRPRVIDRKARNTAIKYDTDYSFDIAQSSIGYDPVYGSIGGFQAAISDVLGNRSVYFLLTNTAETRDQLMESFNFGITYVNRERQLNWGLGAYHLYDEYYNDFDYYYFQREAGLISLFSYPFSKFARVDFTTLARYSNRELRFGRPSREAFLVSNYISWVYDNSLWDFTGPLEGRRYNLTFGVTNSAEDLENVNRLAMADIRHYFRLGRYSAFANRLFAYTSSGPEPRRIYFGGSWSFRGFDRRDFYNRNVLFASNELRFPLIDNLLIGFPFGGLGFRGIRGALFFDVGSAWDDEFDQFLGSFGTGFRVSLGYFMVLRFDFARTTDFETISNTTDFDFFFGWNF